MDRISGLSDDLLVNILLFLQTKDAVSTCILSKRWKFIWMWLPKLEYVGEYMSDNVKLRRFLNKTLPLHRAPVIQSLRIHFDFIRKPEVIKQWVEFAVTRHLRELDVYFRTFPENETLLSSSLYACKSLVVLKLGGDIRLDVPRTACLPSLETLQLEDTNLDGESLRQLLSVCPVLENLSVKPRHRSIAGNISINFSSLQYLSLYIDNEASGLRIDTPPSKYLKLDEFNENNLYISVENMPKLEEAYVDVSYHETKSLYESITSVKRLTLCCPQAMYSDRFVFKQLKHLKLCDCMDCSADLFARLLKDSPNLQVLDFFRMEDDDGNSVVYWNEPSQ